MERVKEWDTSMNKYFNFQNIYNNVLHFVGPILIMISGYIGYKNYKKRKQNNDYKIITKNSSWYAQTTWGKAIKRAPYRRISFLPMFLFYYPGLFFMFISMIFFL
jgi:hypothetical protein